MLLDTPPNHIQRRVNRQGANELTVAGKNKLARRGLCIIGERNVNQTDRFLLTASARPGDARDADAESRTGAFANAGGHRPGYLLADGAMFLDPFLRHAQEIIFRFVRVTDDAFEEIFRAARHIGNAPGEQPAGAAFGRRQRVAPQFEQFADDFFEGFVAAREYIFFEDFVEAPREFVEQLRGLAVVAGLSRQVQFDLAVFEQDGRRRVAVFRVDRRGQLVYARFGQAEDAQGSAQDQHVAHALFQRGRHRRVEDRLHFARRAGQQRDRAFAFSDQHSRGGAVVVFKDLRAADDQSLAGVDLGHRHVAAGEARSDLFDDRVFQNQLPFQDAREDFSRDVIFSRSEPTRCDDDLGAFHRVADGLFQTRLVVADNGFELNVNAHRVEPFGQPQ